MKIFKEILGFIILAGPLFPLLVYFVLAVGLSIFATAKGARRGKKRWGVYVFMTYLLIMFWDLPIVLGTFKYECENNAGFTVHKTLAQWQEENPGVAETLVPYKVPEEYLVKSERNGRVKHYQLPGGMKIEASFWAGGKPNGAKFKRTDGTRGYWLNQRFIWESFYLLEPNARVAKKTKRIIDWQTSEVMAEHIDFSSHPSPGTKTENWISFNPQHLKFWLGRPGCPKGEYPNPKWLMDGDGFNNFMQKFQDFNGEIQ